MRDVVTNVYAKSNYNRLPIYKALGFIKSDNKKKKKRCQRTTIVAIGGYSGSEKYARFVHIMRIYIK